MYSKCHIKSDENIKASRYSTFVRGFHRSSVDSPLQWGHNGRDGFSNLQPHDCLLNRLFRRRSNKTSKLRVTGLCAGNSPGPVNSPHKWPVTRKMFPFDDVIMAESVPMPWPHHGWSYCRFVRWNRGRQKDQNLHWESWRPVQYGVYNVKKIIKQNSQSTR